MLKIAFRFCFAFLVVTQFIVFQSNSRAGDLDLSGNVSLWLTAYEENENGILQPRTLSPAADVTSGFNFKQGRLNLEYQEAKIPVSAIIQIRLEERLAVFDGYVKWCPSQFSHIYIGQMKVPATYESLLISDSSLDFISRSTLSRILADWSLSRSPYYSALYGKYGIEFLDYSGISPHSIIFSATDDFSGNYLINPTIPEKYTNVTGGKVVIGKYAQIGASCVIMPNLTINEGAVVAAMSFVNKDVEKWSIYGGVPAKFIKERTKNLLDKVSLFEKE